MICRVLVTEGLNQSGPLQMIHLLMRFPIDVVMNIVEFIHYDGRPFAQWKYIIVKNKVKVVISIIHACQQSLVANLEWNLIPENLLEII